MKKKTIYKYPLQMNVAQVVDVPVGSEILSVGLQGENLVMWVKCDPSAEKVQRGIVIVGTGHEFNDDYEFLGTVQVGTFVAHVFDKGEL